MVSSSIVVGRVIVDPDHADLARSLLSAEDVLAHMEPIHDSKEDCVTEDDEDYARKLQDEYLQDTLRTIQDYRVAKSLAERDEEYPVTSFVDQFALNYIQELLAISRKSADHDAFLHQSGLPDFTESAPMDSENDFYTNDKDSDSILEEYSMSAREAVAAAVEQRHVSLVLAISAGLPGPSGLSSSSASTGPTLEEEGQRVPPPTYSRSSTDPGDPDDTDDRYERDYMDDRDERDHHLSLDDEGDKMDVKCERDYLTADEEDEVYAGERDNRSDDDNRHGTNNMDDKNRQDVSPPSELDITQVLGDQFGFRTVFCMPCGDLVVGEPTLQAPCGHDICVDCVQDLVATATRDESLFPPSCCRQPFSHTALAPFLTVNLQAIYDAKRIEFATAAGERIFCPNPTCSTFLGSSKSSGETVTCTHCTTVVCAYCRQVAHPGDTCTENVSTLAVKKLAQEQRWQTCPTCRAIIERTAGCNHMVCRCNSNFCYGCGRPMGQCKC